MAANKQTLDEQLEQIAKEHLFIETLKTRNSDRLDFHDISVGCLKAALTAAYNKGRLTEIALQDAEVLARRTR